MSRRRHTIDTEEAELNMRPLLDIVFIMLIFFVVTASFLTRRSRNQTGGEPG